MTDLRRLRIAALALGLMTATVSPGCGTSIPADILIARNVIGVIEMVVTAIGNFSNAYFTTSPNAAEQAKIQAAIADVQASAAAAEALVNGGAALNSGDVAQAFGDFEAAYADLLALVKQLGVVPASLSARAGVEQVAGRLVVPNVEALLPVGVDVAKVHARAAAVRTREARADGPTAHAPIYTRVGDRLCEFYNQATGQCYNPAEAAAEQEGRIVDLADVEGMEPTLAARPISDGRDLVAYLDPRPVPILLIEADWRTPHDCDCGTHSVIAVLPGAVCMRDGATWNQVLSKVRSQGLAGRITGGGPLMDSISEMAARS